jgi:hypothetical protein
MPHFLFGRLPRLVCLEPDSHQLKNPLTTYSQERTDDFIGVYNNERPHQALGGQTVGIREVDDQIWLVSFLGYGLGYFVCLMVARGGIEPPTRGFSVRCSTN